MLHFFFLIPALALGQCDRIDIRLELSSSEAPPTGEEFEIEVRAAGVSEPFDPLWVCGLRYDPGVIELISARPSDAAGPNPADVFRAFPNEGLATFDYTAIPFQPHPVTPDANGRVTLAILTARVLKPVEQSILELTPSYRPVSGLSGEGDSRLWYCLDWQRLNEERVGFGTVVVGEEYSAFVRGDASGDGALTTADPIAILHTLFSGQRDVVCLDSADANDDGKINVTDAIFLIRHLFQSQGYRPLPGPFPDPGFDPTPDGRGCPY